jgi:SAM-dependent methyltransferase
VSDQQTIEDLLARLERERLQADRLYNDALTAVDHAIQAAPTLPDSLPPYDPSRLPALNSAWDILPEGAPPADRSLRGRLRAFVWRMLGPPLEAQKRFNTALLDHLNRNAAVHEAHSAAIRSLVETIRRELGLLVRFESLLVRYLQTITMYVDTKDRSLGGSDLRDRLALTEHRLLALTREVARIGGAGEPRGTSVDRPAEPEAFGGSMDSLTYVAFEDRFRGTQEEIQRRAEDYLPILAAASDIVDIGCGRGELLAALGAHGVSARGVDISPAMVELCRSRGFDVERGDALGFLSRQPDASIGGLVAIQVVEHFEAAYLTRFLENAFRTMRPGAPLVLETINPACWMAFFETYIRDLTHRQPLHPDTLRHLVQATGFTRVDVQFRQPVRDADRLDMVRASAIGTPPAGELAAIIDAVNRHAEKLNGRLFSAMDYVVVARR